PANGPVGLLQVSRPVPVFTPPLRYWYRYPQGTPLEVIQPNSPGWLASPKLNPLGSSGVAGRGARAATAGLLRPPRRPAVANITATTLALIPIQRTPGQAPATTNGVPPEGFPASTGPLPPCPRGLGAASGPP